MPVTSAPVHLHRHGIPPGTVSPPARHPARHGIPPDTVSPPARHPARHGIPHGTVSRTARHPTRHAIPPGSVSHTARTERLIVMARPRAVPPAAPIRFRSRCTSSIVVECCANACALTHTTRNVQHTKCDNAACSMQCGAYDTAAVRCSTCRHSAIAVAPSSRRSVSWMVRMRTEADAPSSPAIREETALRTAARLRHRKSIARGGRVHARAPCAYP